MVKKAIFGVAAATLLAVVFFGRDAASYVRTSAGWVHDSVRESVPMEFEIDRARRMVKELVPDIRKNMHIIAKEEVEVERLKKQITQLTAKQEKDRDNLVTLHNDLKAGGDKYQYAGQSFTAVQAKKDLANRFERFKTNDLTLASLREMQQIREQSLTAAREKLDGMLAAKRQLEVDVEHLEARLKMLEAAQTTSDCNFDDSRLARVKDLVADLRTRLDVGERLTGADGILTGEIPVNGADDAPENIVEEVTEYLNLEADPEQPADDAVALSH